MLLNTYEFTQFESHTFSLTYKYRLPSAEYPILIFDINYTIIR